MQFTYVAYADLLKQLEYNKYNFVSYFNNISEKKQVILRHDVDMSLGKAVKMAELEYNQGVVSTYFVLVRSDFYNIFSAQSQKLLKRLLKLGHDVGLHFDETLYNFNKTSIYDMVEYEKKLLESVIEIEVKSISMHRPSKVTLDSDYRFKDLVNSYSQEYFKKWKYVSDSRMYWREDVEKIISSNAFKSLHILTHPIWYNDEGFSMNEILKSFVNSAKKERYDILSHNLTNLGEILPYGEI